MQDLQKFSDSKISQYTVSFEISADLLIAAISFILTTPTFNELYLGLMRN